VLVARRAARRRIPHNWAELYLDGAWRLLDARKGCFLEPADRYVAFRIISEDAESPLGSVHRFRGDGQLVARMG